MDSLRGLIFDDYSMTEADCVISTHRPKTNKPEVLCYYCSGEGSTDWAEPDGTSGMQACSECDGTGISSRRAGDRNTRAPLPVYDSLGRVFVGDILIHLANTRRLIGVAKLDRDRHWKLPSLRSQYEYFRLIAMRPASRRALLQAEMLAMATRCQTMWDRVRGEA